MPTIEDIEVCPAQFEPNIDWENDMLFSFSQLREVIKILSFFLNLKFYSASGKVIF